MRSYNTSGCASITGWLASDLGSTEEKLQHAWLCFGLRLLDEEAADTDANPQHAWLSFDHLLAGERSGKYQEEATTRLVVLRPTAARQWRCRHRCEATTRLVVLRSPAGWRAIWVAQRRSYSTPGCASACRIVQERNVCYDGSCRPYECRNSEGGDVFAEHRKNNTVANGRPYIWQQDSAPCHTAVKTRQWLTANFDR
uniref:Uncharacterized protein n=1 Tax=Anopheles coluzzii TaxID=1518534 RepID=A0A8W7PBU5_ANOCL